MSTPMLHAVTSGESGPRVAFCHGLFGQGRNWTQIAKGLADICRPTLLDMPDHGRSPWTERFDYVEAAGLVARTLREIDPNEPWIVVGHSMGGMTVMALAQVAPGLFAERVRGAALVGTAAHLGTRRPVPGEGIAMAVLGRLPASARGLPTTARLTAANLFGPDPDPAAVRATGRLTSRTRANVVADWHRAIGELDFREHLAPFAGVRTVVLTGARDRLTPVSAGRRLAAGIPGAQFWSLPGVGHMITYEATAFVADKIELLLDAEPARQGV